MIKQIGLPLRGRPILLNHSYDYRPNWTPLSAVTITTNNNNDGDNDNDNDNGNDNDADDTYILNCTYCIVTSQKGLFNDDNDDDDDDDNHNNNNNNNNNNRSEKEFKYKSQAPVVQTLDSAIPRINHSPVDMY